VSTLRIGYLSGVQGQVLVSFGGPSQVLTIDKGLHSAYLPVHASAGAVVIQQLRGAMPCIGDVEVGTLQPSSAGTAIPAFPVTG
jgi:hypothetical protein